MKRGKEVVENDQDAADVSDLIVVMVDHQISKYSRDSFEQDLGITPPSNFVCYPGAFGGYGSSKQSTLSLGLSEVHKRDNRSGPPNFTAETVLPF